MLGKDVRLFVEVAKTRGDDYIKVEATVVYVEHDETIGELAPRWFTGWGDQGDKWHDLMVSAQADLKDQGDLYGWRLEYDNCGSVDLKRAEAMVKELRRIERRLEALEQQLAHPTDFGQYLVRVGHTLDVECYGFRYPEGYPGGQRFKWVPATQVGYELALRIDDIRRPYLPKVPFEVVGSMIVDVSEEDQS